MFTICINCQTNGYKIQSRRNWSWSCRFAIIVSTLTHIFSNRDLTRPSVGDDLARRSSTASASFCGDFSNRTPSPLSSAHSHQMTTAATYSPHSRGTGEIMNRLFISLKVIFVKRSPHTVVHA